MMGTDPFVWIGIADPYPFPDAPFVIRSFADPDPDRRSMILPITIYIYISLIINESYMSHICIALNIVIFNESSLM